MSGTSCDLIIIGGGPAGLTAAIYACRAQLKVVLIEQMMPGGQVATTEWVENYPGFENGVSGYDLMQHMEKQARQFGLEIVSGSIEKVRFQQGVKEITAGGRIYNAKAIIIATGSHPRTVGVPGEDKFRGRGVSYCATCDGPFFKDKDIVVVGGGSSGLQESLYLTRFVRSIELIEVLDHLNAEKILQKRASENDKISIHLKHALVSINGDQKVTSVRVKDHKTGKEREIKADGVFVWVGQSPNTKFLKDVIELDRWGFIPTSTKMETSVPGVYAAGDVRVKDVRQIVTAVSDGAVAAEMALKYIEAMENNEA